MKKSVLYMALFSFTLPLSALGLGLGDIKVESSLDQPFDAEIELVDIGSSSPNSIRVGVADPDSFERGGMERIAALSLLSFKIEKNSRGRYVVKIQSLERMTEPFIELVVDLAWPTGQLYKAYTVLLDPPGYKLVPTKQHTYAVRTKKSSNFASEPGVINKDVISSAEHNPYSLNDSKTATTYGPTITNENVWQIAQRYKTSEVILPQVVLAIVGMNPNVFTQGNLNGLQVGVRLVIPSTNEIKQVPAELSTQEVMAHDTAWNAKQPINHVLSPPYIASAGNGQTNPMYDSVLPAVPKLSTSQIPSLADLNKLINVNSAIKVDNKTETTPAQNNQSMNHEAATQTELNVATAAVESMRESNALLMEQLRQVQLQNKTLQAQLEKRDKELELIRAQISELTKDRKAVAGQAVAANPTQSDSSSIWPWFLLFGLAGGGGYYAYNYLKRDEDEEEEHSPKSFVPLIQPITTEEPVPENKIVSAVEPQVIAATEPEQSEPVKEPKPEEEISVKPAKTKKSKAKKALTTPDEPAVVNGSSGEEMTEQEQVEPTEMSSKTDEVVQETFDQPLPVASEVIQPENELDTRVATDDFINQDEGTLSNEDKSDAESDTLEFEFGLHHEIEGDAQAEEAATTEVGGGSQNNSGTTDDDMNLNFETFTDHQLEETPSVINASEPTDNIEFDAFSSEQPVTAPITEEQNLGELTPELVDFFATPDTDSEQSNSEKGNNASAHPADGFDNIIANAAQSNPLKSDKALDTLLALARTYIGMDDFESARHSLEEVLEHGSEVQKEEAKQLLAELKDK